MADYPRTREFFQTLDEEQLKRVVEAEHWTPRVFTSHYWGRCLIGHAYDMQPGDVARELRESLPVREVLLGREAEAEYTNACKNNQGHIAGWNPAAEARAAEDMRRLAREELERRERDDAAEEVEILEHEILQYVPARA